MIVDRPAARYSTWYELPRSQGRIPGRHGTFDDCIARLDDIRAMGFDVIYLPPIHPIGRTHRKGRDNSLVAEPGDPGSPWAIGNEHGGHSAIEPALGTVEDFRRFVQAARDRGIEVALDYAIQCSPDHPWVREHPEWFHYRPDGTIKYAENPPRRTGGRRGVPRPPRCRLRQPLPMPWPTLSGRLARRPRAATDAGQTVGSDAGASERDPHRSVTAIVADASRQRQATGQASKASPQDARNAFTAVTSAGVPPKR